MIVSENDEIKFKKDISNKKIKNNYFLESYWNNYYTIIQYIQVGDDILLLSKHPDANDINLFDTDILNQIKENHIELTYETLYKVHAPYEFHDIIQFAKHKKPFSNMMVDISIKDEKWNITKPDKYNKLAQILYNKIEKYNNNDAFEKINDTDKNILDLLIFNNILKTPNSNIRSKQPLNFTISDEIKVDDINDIEMTETKPTMINILSKTSVFHKNHYWTHLASPIKYNNKYFSILKTATNVYITKI